MWRSDSVQCRSDKISIDRYLHLKFDRLMSTAAYTPSAFTYPLQAFTVGKGYALFIAGYFCPDIFTVTTVCVQPFTYNIIIIRQFPGGGLVPLKHGSGSGLCQSTLREDTTVHRAAMYTKVLVWDEGDLGMHYIGS